MGDSWVRDGAWEPLEGNGVSCGGGRREENTIATVVVRGRADIISGEAVSGKRAALAGLSYMRTLVPGTARGVWFKSKLP